MAEPLLRAQNIGKTYNTACDPETAPRMILENFSMEIFAGEIVCILGPSGCGKSTLLRICSSLDTDFTGNLFFRSERMTTPDRNRCLIFQETSQVYPWLTALGNVEFSLKSLFHDFRKHRDRYRRKAETLLTEVGLSDAAVLYPHQLSGGMRQRLALARTMAVEPQLYLLDEPFSNLDRDIRKKLRDLILKIHGETKSAFLFVTHDVEEALYLGDRILCLDENGRIIDERKQLPLRPRDIYDRHFMDMVREYDSLLNKERSNNHDTGPR